MLYINLNSNKILTFGTIILGLFSAVAITFSIKGYIPADYFSVNGVMTAASLPLTAMVDRLNFVAKNSNNNLSLASIGQILNLKNYNLDPSKTSQDVPVLLYHGITEKADRFSLTRETFKDQMFALKQAGYNTISLEELDQFLNGQRTLPAKSFLLTFDDGRADSYYGADPTLQALGFKAVMFVATADSIDPDDSPHSYYLHTALLRRMVDSGRWEIGSHAIQSTGGFVPINADQEKANFLSNKMWLLSNTKLEDTDEYLDRIDNELANSKKELETTFGKKITAFSYPFGDYGQQTENNPEAEKTIRQVVTNNYSMAFTQVWPNDNIFTSNYPGQDAYRLRRIEVDTTWSGDNLTRFLNTITSKTLPFSEDFIGNNSWKSSWGKVSLNEQSILLEAKASTTGAFTFLDGTANWRDYFYTAKTEWSKNSYLSLIARYQDDSNYLTCAFSRDNVQIIEKLAGVTYVLNTVPNIIKLPISSISVGILVDGNTVYCYEGSQVVAFSHQINKKLLSGGIGAQVWNKKLNAATANINSITVVPLDLLPELKKDLPIYDPTLSPAK
jgi:peptidoglycan/xylan/chitin deacetylase (PgdA/CDA1 family)